MTVYKKILVSYDTSKPSEIALEHAITIAKMSAMYTNTTIDVIVLHVVQEMPVPTTFGINLFKSKQTGDMITLEQYLKDITLEIKKDAENMLEDKIEKYRNIENVSLEIQVLIGNPSDQIIKFANDERIELVIMGNTGLGGLSKIVSGSVAKNVSEKANCPVMLVR
ncbi:MAG TPA: universal stress protein [Nitrososphaeraceae archaeon]|nr:universal stress protein [Nitrososphaeraceae archaeon]